MNRPRRGLCSRCGAVLEGVVVDSSGRGACPSCGLGWTERRLVSSGPTAVPRPGLERGRQRALGRVNRQRQQAASGWRFAVYGLDDSWTGRRWLGGWGGHDGGLDRLELAHGDPWHDHAALVRITTWAPTHRAAERVFSREDDLAVRRRNAAKTLAQHLWHETSQPTDGLRATFTEANPVASWDPLTLRVEGAPVTFRSLRAGAHWVALGSLGDLMVALHARHLAADAVALMEVADLASYLLDDGSRR